MLDSQALCCPWPGLAPLLERGSWFSQWPPSLLWHRGGRRHIPPLPDFYVYRPLLS